MSGGNYDRNYRLRLPHPPILAFPAIINPDSSGQVHDPWRPPREERIVSRPVVSAGNPVQTQSPVPTIRNLSRSLDSSRSSNNEQGKSRMMNKLKKEIYDPIPKKLSQRLSLYYRDRAKTINQEKDTYKEEEGKRCAICLEDFEPKEEVIVTPCDHMFHEDCILPWIKSQGKCPVCRSVIEQGSQGSETRPSVNVVGEELLSFLGAMDRPWYWTLQ